MAKKGSLEKLIKQHPVDFFKKKSFSQSPVNFNRTKIFSTDVFEDVVLQIVEKERDSHHTLFLSTASGTDDVFSLYANIVAHSNKKFHPHLLIADKKKANLFNSFFRYATLLINPDNKNSCVADMLGVPENNNIPAFLNGEIMAKEYFRKREYDAKAHKQMLVEHISKYTLLDNKTKSLFIDSANHIVDFLGGKYVRRKEDIKSDPKKDELYKLFIDGLFQNIQDNKRTHYLSSNVLYKTLVNSADFKKQLFHIHFLMQDLTQTTGTKSLKEIMKDYVNLPQENMRPISGAIVHNLEKSFGNLLPFLAEEADYTVFSRKIQNENDQGLTKKIWIMKDSTDLAVPSIEVPGLEKFNLQVKKREPITSLKKITSLDGLEPTLIMSNLLIGSQYSDEARILDMIDIANGRGAELWITGEALEGPHIYKNKNSRKLLRPDLQSLDSQMGVFKNFRDKFKGNVVYVLGPKDKLICEDLRTRYVRTIRAMETSRQPSPGLNLAQLEEVFKTRYEEDFRILHQYVYPFLLRKGEDLTHYAGEVDFKKIAEGKEIPVIVDLVNAFKRFEKGEKVTEKDIALFGDAIAIENTPKFSVFDNYSGISKRETGKANTRNVEKQRSIRAIGNTKFSGEHMYANTEDILRGLVRLSASGLLKNEIPEKIIIDLHQPSHHFRIENNRAIITVPHMVDDRRKYDDDYSSDVAKTEVSSPTQKRTAQGVVNIPGATLITGDPATKMNIEFYYPRIADRIKQFQKSAKKEAKDINVMIIQDTQIGSLSEMLEMNVKTLDYGVYKKNASCVIGIGDRGQFRNYPGMPNENALLGPGITIENMQRTIVNISRPYFSLPQIKFWGEVEGNHESNTDKLAQGHHFLEPLRSAIEQHVYDTDHKLEYRFPRLLRMADGTVLQAPFGRVNVGGLNLVYAHTFAERGGGKGRASSPTTYASEFAKNQSGFIGNVDILFNGHYHQFEMRQENEVLCCMFASQANATGFEFRRQMYSEPRVAYMNITKEGLISIETLSANEIMKHEIQNPYVKTKGLENFINEACAVQIDDFSLNGSNENANKLRIYNRKPFIKTIPTID